MEDYNLKNDKELQEMRDQIALLKRKLDRETIISEKLLRDTMKRKAGTINVNAWISIAASLFVIVFALIQFPQMGLSNLFIAITIVMMLVCDFFTWRYHKNVNRKTMAGDLVTVAQVMKKLKDDYHNWLKYGIMMILFWAGWFASELLFQTDSPKEELFLVIGMVVGLAIGGFIGMRMHKSVVNNADEIIKQIEEE